MVSKKTQVFNFADGSDNRSVKTDSVHWLGTLLTNNEDKLVDLDSASSHIDKLLSKGQVQALGKVGHSFSDESGQQGFTLVYCLAESHIAVHTWPEHRAVELDVYLCNHTNDNRNKCQSIYTSIVDYFEVNKQVSKDIRRPNLANLAG